MRVRLDPSRGSLPFVLTVLVIAGAWSLGTRILPSPSTADAASAAQEDPATPTPEPTPLWAERTLYGGPIHDLVVAPDTDDEATDTQRIWATGNGIFHATRGVTWTRSIRDVPDAVGIIAPSADVAFVTDSEGGGHRTTNRGRSWTPMRIGSDGPLRFAAASPDFEEEEQVYAIFQEDGRLWRTSDRGRRWTEVVIERGADIEAGAVGFSPLFGVDEIVFVGSSEGFHESTDGGLSWSEGRGADAGGPTFGPAVGPLAYQGIHVPREFGDDPKRQIDPDVQELFAWTPAGLWRTSDRGLSWQTMQLPAGIETLHDVAISPGWPEDPVIAVAGAGAGEAGPLGAVSEDGGQSWREIPGGPGLVGTSIAFSHDFWHFRGPDQEPTRRGPTLTRLIYLPGVYRGFDFTGDPEADPPIPSDFVPASPIVLRREIHLGTNGAGVWSSEDMGRSWTASLETIRNVRPSALAHLGERELLAGSHMSGLFRSTDDGHSWQRLDSPLPRGEGGRILTLAVSPAFASDRTVLASTQSGLWISRDAGGSWTATSGPAGVFPLAFSPAYATDRTIVAGGMRSTDGGSTWAAIPGLENVNLNAVLFSPKYADDQRMWAGGTLVDDPSAGSGLLLSSDGGQSWVANEDRDVRDKVVWSLAALAVDPSEGVRLSVGTDRSMLRSEDDGLTFVRVSPMSSRGVVGMDGAVVREPSLTGILVAATGDGAYWSVNRGMSFVREPRSPRPLEGITLSPDVRRIVALTATGLTFADLAALIEAGD